MKTLFFTFLLLVQFSFGAMVCEDIPGPRWLTAKSVAILPEAEVLQGKLIAQPEMRFVHDLALADKIKEAFKQVSNVFSADVHVDPTAPFQKILGHFMDAEALTWDVQTLLYLALARQLDDTPLPEVLYEFEKTEEVVGLVAAITQISSPEHAQAFTAKLTQGLQESKILPALIVFSEQSSVIGVHTLLQSFVTHEVAPLVISLKGGSVHGGLIKGSFATALHDFLHGTQYAKVILSTPFADTMLPQVKAHVATLKPTDPAAVMQIVQAHLMMHEAIVSLKGNLRRQLKDFDGLKAAILRQVEIPLMHQGDRLQDYIAHEFPPTFFAEQIMGILQKEHDRFSFLDYLRTLKVLGEDEGVTPEDVLVTVTPKTIQVTCGKLGSHMTSDIQWSAPEVKGLKTRVEYEFTLEPTVFGGEMTEPVVIGKIIFKGHVSLSDSAVIRQNVSDYAWLGKQVGFVDPGRNLKESPLSDGEMHALIKRIMAVDTPLLRLASA